MEAGEELVERVSNTIMVRVEKPVDAGDVRFGDAGNVLGPCLPIATLADLLDDACVDSVAEVVEFGPQQAELELDLGSEVVVGLRGVRGGVPREDVVVTDLVGDADDVDLWGPLLVQVDLVDGRFEVLVVGAEGLEDIPDDLVPLVVAQRVLGRHAGGHRDR